MNLTKAIDQLYTLRQDRLALQKQVDALEEQEKSLRAEVFAGLKASPTEAVNGAVAHGEIKRSIVPQLIDQDVFLAWARKSPKRADVLKIAVVTPAWRLHVENGETVPGVETFQKEELSLTKVKK